jgi:hypothetical protein
MALQTATITATSLVLKAGNTTATLKSNSVLMGFGPHTTNIILLTLIKRSSVVKQHTYSRVDYTYNYDKFEISMFNRPVRQNKRLLDSVRDVGIIHPIIVAPDSRQAEKYIIIDGQHRHAIAKDLSLPLPFLICYTINEDLATSLNSTGNNWVTKEYLDKYVAKGHQEYIKFKGLVNKYGRDLSIGYILEVCKTGHKMKAFKDGKFTIDQPQLDQATRLLTSIAKLVEVVRVVSPRQAIFFTQQKLLPGVLKLLNHPDYSEDRLIVQLSKPQVVKEIRAVS